MISFQRYLSFKKFNLSRLFNIPGLTRLRLLLFLIIVTSGINVFFLGKIQFSKKITYDYTNLSWREWNLKVDDQIKSEVKENFVLTNAPGTAHGLISRTVHKMSQFADNFSMVLKTLMKYISSYTSPSKKDCPIDSLSNYLTSTSEKISCVPHMSNPEACAFAAKLYPLDSTLLTCRVKGKGDLCSVKVAIVSNEVFIDELQCKRDICDPGQPVTLLHTSPENGMMIERNYTTLFQLEGNLTKTMKSAINNNLNYVFLKCTDLFGDQYAQLIPLPVKIKLAPHLEKKRSININLVWIDSVSRAHFYRSLPHTINTFKKIRQDKKMHAYVFDFELFQSVHGHTSENEMALFAGKLTETKLGEESNHPVQMDVMFGEFKKYGYQTLWMEDLCWEALWGLSLDIEASSWSSLVNKLRMSSIDFTGLTHSSCEILHSLGVNTPFSGPNSNQICYNGEFQDTYLLQYNYNFFKTISKVTKSAPLFSFTSLSAAHDHISLRTQTLDLALSYYVKLMASDERTLTIILSDHGNTYTQYTYGVLEGQFEMFHPAMFMIIPKKVALFLGNNIVQNLHQNQKRLVTMLDLHPALMSIARTGKVGIVSNVGIFSKVSANRTCSNVQLQTPNLCVCEGWDSPTTNDMRRRGLMEFGLGQLNNILQKEMLGKISVCHKLYALEFGNVRERSSKQNGSLITTMEVIVKAGNVVDQTEDIFHIEVQTEPALSKKSLKMMLVNFDRHTMFGEYKKCAPKGVNLKLCICSIDGSGKPVLQHKSWLDDKYILENLPWMSEQKAKISPISNDFQCLFVLQRTHGSDDSKGFEVVNSCEKFEFRVIIQTQAENMRFSSQPSFTVTVKPQSSRFVFAVVKHIHYLDASFSYAVRILTRREVKNMK